MDVGSGEVLYTAGAEGPMADYGQLVTDIISELGLAVGRKLDADALAEMTEGKPSLEEFEKFMRIERVREALAADLGVETPPRVEAKDENVAAGDPSPPSVSNDASHPAAPAVPSSTPPRRVASSPRGAAASNGDGDAAFVAAASERFRNPHGAGDDDVETTQTTHVTSEFHRERVLAYLDGFKTLLLDLRQKVDEIATANVLTVGGAVERADARLETALARVDAMVQEETRTLRR